MRNWQVEVTPSSPNLEKTIQQITLKILSDLDCSNVPESIEVISFYFCDQPTIQKLNLEHRGKDYPTDVLSFPMVEEESGLPGNSLGDVLICASVAEQQAPEFGNSREEEILRLVIHGTLHLLGYDHENVPLEKARLMENTEDELQATIADTIDIGPLNDAFRLG